MSDNPLEWQPNFCKCGQLIGANGKIIDSEVLDYEAPKPPELTDEQIEALEAQALKEQQRYCSNCKEPVGFQEDVSF